MRDSHERRMWRNAAESAVAVNGDMQGASSRAMRSAGNGCLLMVFGIGLLSSATPWWFKLTVLASAYPAYHLARSRQAASRQLLHPEAESGAVPPTSFGRRQPRSAAMVAGDQGVLHPAMEQELRRLDLYQRGLGSAAIRYVARGERPDTLDAIAALSQANLVSTSPYQKAEPKLHEMLGKTNQALIKGEIQPGPEVLRLVQVRIATKNVRAPWNKQLTETELAVSGLNEMLFHGLSLMQDNYKVKWAEVIPLKTVFAHFRQVGGTMVDLFAFILRRSESEFVTQSIGSWSASHELAEYLNTFPAAFAEALRVAEPKQRATGIKLAEHYKATSAPEIEAALVAMLTRPFDKTDREIATSALARLAPEQLLNLLQLTLPKADIDTRHGLVQAAGRNGTPEILAFLSERNKIEKAAKVRAAIQTILEASAVEKGISADGEAGASGYAAIDGSFIALPERKDLGVDEVPPPTDEARMEYAQLVKKIEERRLEAHAAYLEKYAKAGSTPTPAPVPYTREIVEQTFATLTEGKPLPSGNYQLAHSIRFQDEGQAWLRSVLDRLPLIGALRILKASTFDDAGGLVGTPYAYRQDHLFGVNLLRSWLEQGRLDLRDLLPGAHLRTLLSQQNHGRFYGGVLSTLQALPREAVWPWVAENMEVLDEALGLKPTERPIPLDRALEAVGLLPVMPQRYFARVLDIAVAEKRPLRRQAMALLRDGKDLVARIERLLDDKRQQVRINAATWLADIRSTSSEGPLRKRLNREKADPVRTALIEALQRLGADLSDVISPASLIAQAKAATAKGTPDLPEWLPIDALPTPAFLDGTPAPAELLRHWLALAIRLKDPSLTGQFGIYLDQLRPDDAQALSRWVLDHWIAYDTQTASLEEANAYAVANYRLDWRWTYRPQTAELRDQIVAELVRRKSGEMLNSGSETKGMLALACRADPLWAAQRVRWFLKNHGRRSNQAMALLDMLAGMQSPVALQVVIAASVRLKQKSTQKHAAEIAERYADDRGWSVDELSDRTVPDAGFDDDGVLALPCGEDEKPYAARLDAQLQVHLFNPEGKEVKALPAGDDEASKESKKALAAAKKELKQIVDIQRGRLFEAMCVERSWPVADWRSAFHEHPVMRGLIERLVWQGLDADGAPRGLFRPTQEGDFTDAADKPVDIDRFDRLRLAHGALLDESDCEAWVGHLKDYEVDPLIAQFGTTRVPLSAGQGEATMIEDRKGWLADSLTYRGIAEKRGYERVMGDGGGCNEYEKGFRSHGLTATIHHSGSYAVDENNQVALKGLSFRKAGQYTPIKLMDVPPVMLAECWADFHALAAKGAFDPGWEKKAPW